MEVSPFSNMFADTYYLKPDVTGVYKLVLFDRRNGYPTDNIDGLTRYIYGRFRAAFRMDASNLVKAHQGKERLKQEVKVKIQEAQHSLVELLRMEYQETRFKFPENYTALIERIRLHLALAFKKFPLSQVEQEAIFEPITRGVASSFCALDLVHNMFPSYGIIMTPPDLDSKGIDIIAHKEVRLINGKSIISTFFFQVKTINQEKGMGFGIRAGRFNSDGVYAMKTMSEFLEKEAQKNSNGNPENGNTSLQLRYDYTGKIIGSYKEKSENIVREITPVLLLICPERYCLDYASNPSMPTNLEMVLDPDKVFMRRLQNLDDDGVNYLTYS